MVAPHSDILRVKGNTLINRHTANNYGFNKSSQMRISVSSWLAQIFQRFNDTIIDHNCLYWMAKFSSTTQIMQTEHQKVNIYYIIICNYLTLIEKMKKMEWKVLRIFFPSPKFYRGRILKFGFWIVNVFETNRLKHCNSKSRLSFRTSGISFFCARFLFFLGDIPWSCPVGLKVCLWWC